MRLLKGLLLKPTLSLLSWILRHRNGNSIIIGGPLGWSWYATLDTTHHGALAGPANAHRHSDMANIGVDDHHAQLHPTEHQDGGAQEISIAGLSGEPAELTTHKGLESAHHTKFTITEHDVVARHPLAVLDPAVCSETEAPEIIKANVEVGDLKAPTKALAMNSQNITGVASLTATELHGTTYWGDVRLEDVECPVCHRKFKTGDRLVFIVNKVEEKFITAVPVHLVCDGG